MRHRVAGRPLSRNAAHGRALRRNLIRALVEHEQIRTTKAKALAVRGDADKLISLAKTGMTKRQAAASDVHERRLAAVVLGDKKLVTKLFDEIAPRYAERPGGYTRVLDLEPRKGDNAEMALLQFS
ncbi:MAG: 50S ribosomal protein L17 [Chloroflexi bacterium]|nr:50S ribosomal protein L17 [Chloroflexota bacterium]